MDLIEEENQIRNQIVQNCMTLKTNDNSITLDQIQGSS